MWPILWSLLLYNYTYFCHIRFLADVTYTLVSPPIKWYLFTQYFVTAQSTPTPYFVTAQPTPIQSFSQPNQPQFYFLSQPKQPQLDYLSQPIQPQLDILSQSNIPQLNPTQPHPTQLNPMVVILKQPNLVIPYYWLILVRLQPNPSQIRPSLRLVASLLLHCP